MHLLKIFGGLVLAFLLHHTVPAQEWVSYQSPHQINDLVDTGDELLLATDQGLVVLHKATLERTFFDQDNANLGNNHIQAITMSPTGEAWIGTYDVVVSRFNGTDFEDVTIPEGESLDSNTLLYDLKFAPNGELWVGTSAGLFRRQGQSWTHYGPEELGPSFADAWDIEIDADGVVYVGSRHIFAYADGVWSDISETTALFGYANAELFLSAAGDLYFAGDLDRVGRYDGTAWQIFDIDEPGDFTPSLPFAGEIVGFTEDAAGAVYFNTPRHGIYQRQEDAWTRLVDEQTTAYQNKTSYYYIDADNRRWLNQQIDLSVLDNGTLQSATIARHT
ncbi:MAG: hypothetical protein KDC54_02930, partial [Lewinella sp.]|nr:hypothetical protein [Lewinella sp.]